MPSRPYYTFSCPDRPLSFLKLSKPLSRKNASAITTERKTILTSRLASELRDGIYTVSGWFTRHQLFLTTFFHRKKLCTASTTIKCIQQQQHTVQHQQTLSGHRNLSTRIYRALSLQQQHSTATFIFSRFISILIFLFCLLLDFTTLKYHLRMPAKIPKLYRSTANHRLVGSYGIKTTPFPYENPKFRNGSFQQTFFLTK